MSNGYSRDEERRLNNEAAMRETERRELVKKLKRLLASSNALFNCVIHINNYVETYDEYDLGTAYQFMKSQLDQIKRHISKIEATIGDE